MTYKFEKIDKENTADDYWQRIYEYTNECHKIRGLDFEEKPLNAFKSSFLLWLNNGAASYMVWKNDKAAGSFEFNIFPLNKKQLVFYNHLIDSSVEDELLRGIFERFLDYDPQSQYFYIKSANGENDFIPSKLAVKAWEYRALYEWDISLLNKEELLNNLDLCTKRYSDYSIKFYEKLPGELLKSYCKMYVRLIKEMPGHPDPESYNLTEEELKSRQESLIKNEQFKLRYLLYDQANNLIGVTTVGINKKNPNVGYQHFTGIAKKYRGRGLSKYLKLAMLLKLQNNYPKLIKLETEIYKENSISIKMNESMGYKQNGYRKVYLIPRERIKNWLDENCN